jgi:hypothetical protein
MSPRGGKLPGQRGRAKQPEGTHFKGRYFSLPPDVVQWLDAQPSGQRSRIVADALRAWIDKHTDSDTNAKATTDTDRT